MLHLFVEFRSVNSLDNGRFKRGKQAGEKGGAYTTLQLVNRWYFGVLKLYVQSFNARKMQFNL